MSYNLVDPTTGDLTRVAGGGFSIPVGTLIQQYKKKPISGYLYCDGSTFDENAYPALYMYLGTNVLPDYRECVMVGAEQNTTDTIATHDVYGEGEFKDDQLQTHKHMINTQGEGSYTGTYSIIGRSSNLDEATVGKDTTTTGDARTGDTTHGKQKAVYVYIKATSGLAENQQDNVLNDVMDKINALHEQTTGYIEGSLLSSAIESANLYYQKFGDNKLVINGWISLGSAVPTQNTKIFTLPNGWKVNSNYLLPCYTPNSNSAYACMIDISTSDVNSYTPLPSGVELRFCAEIYLQ